MKVSRMRVTPFHHGDGIRSLHLPQCLPDSIRQRAAARDLHVVYQLHQHFRVRIAGEDIATLRQRILQHGIVFYRAVMHQGDAPALRHLGMGVTVTGLTVRGPAGMANPEAAAHILPGNFRFQGGNLALRLVHIQPPVFFHQSNACTVISTVLQAVKSFHQHVVCLAMSYISYDSAHCWLVISG